MEELITTIGELQDGDQVFGTDNQWHSIKVQPIVVKDLYLMETDAGNVICSFDHNWIIYKQGRKIELNTKNISDDILTLSGCHIGKEDGPKLIGLRQLENGECRCISVDSPDHQFEILTDSGEPIFTHNCQLRVVCGRLNSTASMMALGSSLATTINGEHKGAGIVASQGVVSNVQYYYADTSWIEQWYADRGFDRNGYEEGKKEIELDTDMLQGEEEFSISDDDKHFEFESESKDVLNKHEQKFENV